MASIDRFGLVGLARRLPDRRRARNFVLALLIASTTGCYQSHQLPYESTRCAPAPREGIDDRVLLLEREGTALLLNEETFEGLRRPVTRIADTIPEGLLSLSGSPDGATALVTLSSVRGDHEHVWIVDLDSGAVLDVAGGLNRLAGTACGAQRDRGDGTHERGSWSHGAYRGDGRRILFTCVRSLFDDEAREIRRLRSSAHEYDLGADIWRTVAGDCGFASYSEADACSIVVSSAACNPYRFAGYSAVVDDEPRSIPHEVYSDAESVWLAVGGGYFITRREGTTVALLQLGADGSVLRELRTADDSWLLAQSPDGTRAAVAIVRDGSTSVVWFDVRTGRELAVVGDHSPVETSPDAANVVVQETTAPHGAFVVGVDGSSHPLPTGFCGLANWGQARFDPSGAFLLPLGAPYQLVTSSGDVVLDLGEERMECRTTSGGSWVQWGESEILSMSFRVARP